MGQVGFYATHHVHYFCLRRPERPIGWARWYTPNPTWPKMTITWAEREWTGKMSVSQAQDVGFLRIFA